MAMLSKAIRLRSAEIQRLKMAKESRSAESGILGKASGPVGLPGRTWLDDRLAFAVHLSYLLIAELPAVKSQIAQAGSRFDGAAMANDDEDSLTRMSGRDCLNSAWPEKG